MKKLLSITGSFFANLFDTIFPRSKEVRFLENSRVQDFVTVVKTPRDNLPHIVSLFDYRDRLVKTAVWEIKFRGNQKITRLAAQLIYEHILGELGERILFSGDIKFVIIPVPLATKRLRERGFNQAERLARIIEELDDGKSFTVRNAVARIKETPSQTRSANRAERLKNLRGAFAVTNPNEIKGRDVIILDDVATTGATIGEIRSVLLKAGATSVTGLTFAH